MRRITLLLLAAALGGGFAQAASRTTTAAALKAIRAVGPEGRGNAQASAAWKQLSTGGTETLPAILEAMDGASELSLNWLRSAVDTIAARETAAGNKLPAGELEKFVRNTKHHPRARRLAYDLLVVAAPEAAQHLLAGMADDPSTELRRDAIQRLADEAAKLKGAGQSAEAIAKYQAALKSARDVDQIEATAKQLKELGQPVSLPDVFGWVSQWKAIGPFDSAGGAGFEKVFPPEQRVDLAAEHDGKSGKVRWVDLGTKGDYGMVDLNKPFGALKGVAGYAYAEFQADKARPVEVRLGCKNAWKVWLNGKLLFGRDEYHRGIEIDQYRLASQFKSGRNTILVKICQNEQTEDWTKEWEFQLRLTDALGTPVKPVQKAAQVPAEKLQSPRSPDTPKPAVRVSASAAASAR